MDLASVNNEVLREILLLLPAKSLIKFKSVCKRWLSLISSDHFCHQHTLRHPKVQQSLIIQMHTRQFFYLNQTIDGGKVMIPYSLTIPDHQILQDCNGLLLLEPRHDRDSYYVYDPTTNELKLNPKNSFYVYNPTTRQSRKITLPQIDKFPYVESISLAFDPSKSPYYKLICLMSTSYDPFYISDSYAYRIEVYDSESQTWKRSLESSMCPRIYRKGAVHWNNSIFWTTSESDRFCRFDIAKNEIEDLSFPPRYDGLYKNGDFGCLQESNGHLYCFQLINESCAYVDVWELGGDDHYQWFSKYHATISPRCVQHGLIYKSYDIDINPVRFVGGDEATCTLLTYEPWPEGIMAYNFLDDSYKLLVDIKGHPIYEYSILIEGFLFGETLALV